MHLLRIWVPWKGGLSWRLFVCARCFRVRAYFGLCSWQLLFAVCHGFSQLPSSMHHIGRLRRERSRPRAGMLGDSCYRHITGRGSTCRLGIPVCASPSQLLLPSSWRHPACRISSFSGPHLVVAHVCFCLILLRDFDADISLGGGLKECPRHVVHHEYLRSYFLIGSNSGGLVDQLSARR